MALAWLAVALFLCALAMVRPIDHDESQYVASAALTAHGLLPYRDYFYSQTPLQPVVLAPIVRVAGDAAWPALRLANALLGAATLFAVWRAARLVAPARIAWATVALFATCDSLLFSIGTARNDALPAACLGGALWLAVRAEAGRGRRGGAIATGLLLAAAAASKLNYAFPAMAYGLWALTHPRHRPGWVVLGALPIAAFVAWSAALAPAAFLFDVPAFSTAAPADYYADRPWKLTGWAKAIDLVKFLALGPALLAAVTALRRPRPAMLLWLTVAGLIAAAVPTTTWRQYLLPMLPPLFVLLASRWARHPPAAVARVAFVTFAAAGLAPTIAAVATGQPAMAAAWAQSGAIRAAMDAARVTGPVATLSPQFLPATGRLPDLRFAAGPFYFRNRRLAPPPGAPLVAARDLPHVPLPPAVLAGGEDGWTGGNGRLDQAMEREAARRGYRRVMVTGTPWRLWVRR